MKWLEKRSIHQQVNNVSWKLTHQSKFSVDSTFSFVSILIFFFLFVLSLTILEYDKNLSKYTTLGQFCIMKMKMSTLSTFITFLHSGN